MKKNITVAAAMAIGAALQLLFMRYMLQVGSKDLLGLYTYVLSIITPIIVFFNFGTRNLRNTVAVHKFELKELFFVKTTGWVGALICILVVSNVFLMKKVAFAIVLFVIFYKLLESISDIAISNYIYTKKVNVYLLSSFLKLISLSLTIVICLYYELTVEITLLIVSIVFLLSSAIDFKEILVLFEGVKENSALLKKGVMLGIASLVASLTVNYPRIYLGEMESFNVLAELGIISFIVTTANLAWNSYLQLSLSIISELYVKQPGSVNKYFIKRYIIPTIVAGGGGLLLLLTLGDSMFQLVFGNDVVYTKSELVAVSLVCFCAMLQGASNYLLVGIGETIKLTKVNIIFLAVIFITIPLFYAGNLTSILYVISSVYFANAILNYLLVRAKINVS